MSRAFSQAKLKGEERRAILQAIQIQMRQVIIDGVTLALQELLEQTIRYFSLEGIVRVVVRSASRLERTNRALRRTFRQVGCFSSPKGAEAAVYIQVTRLNALWARTSWWDASHSLALDLLYIDP